MCRLDISYIYGLCRLHIMKCTKFCLRLLTLLNRNFKSAGCLHISHLGYFWVLEDSIKQSKFIDYIFPKIEYWSYHLVCDKVFSCSSKMFPARFRFFNLARVVVILKLFDRMFILILIIVPNGSNNLCWNE